MEEYLLLRHLDIPEHHHLTQQAVVHHIQHLVQEAAISRKVTAQQVAAIRLIVQGLQLRDLQRSQRKHRLLQWIYLQHVRITTSVIYTIICDRTYRRMVSTSNGRVDER